MNLNEDDFYLPEKCIICEGDFPERQVDDFFCSHKCQDQWYQRQANRPPWAMTWGGQNRA